MHIYIYIYCIPSLQHMRQFHEKIILVTSMPINYRSLQYQLFMESVYLQLHHCSHERGILSGEYTSYM